MTSLLSGDPLAVCVEGWGLGALVYAIGWLASATPSGRAFVGFADRAAARLAGSRINPCRKETSK